jgi:hypothetical protein
MNRRRYDLSPKISILGCTLWTALDPDALDILSWSLTDFKRITDFTPEQYQRVHKKDLHWLEESIEAIRTSDSSRKIVVFTHHAPTVEGTSDPKWIGGLTNSAFAIELTEAPWWGLPVTLWAFGHTHWSCDFERNGTRVVSNQRGYGHGSDSFDVKKVISI